MGCGDDLRWVLRWVLVGLIEWVAVDCGGSD